MNLGFLSYLLACISVLNTLLWYLYSQKVTEVLLISTSSYMAWFLVFWYTGSKRVNLADRITIGRWLLFVLCVMAAIYTMQSSWWILFGISLAVVLDGVDGWLARKLNIESEHGRVLDMEVDHMTTSLLVALSVMIIGVGPWLLFLNLLRPVYLLLGRQKMREKEYRSSSQLMRAKIICILSQILLIINLAPVLDLSSKQFLSALNLILLSYSFGIDLWLEDQHHKASARSRQ